MRLSKRCWHFLIAPCALEVHASGMEVREPGQSTRPVGLLNPPLLGRAAVHVVDAGEVDVLAVPTKRREKHAEVEPRLVDPVDGMRHVADRAPWPARDVVQVPAASTVIACGPELRRRVPKRRVRPLSFRAGWAGSHFSVSVNEGLAELQRFLEPGHVNACLGEGLGEKAATTRGIHWTV